MPKASLLALIAAGVVSATTAPSYGQAAPPKPPTEVKPAASAAPTAPPAASAPAAPAPAPAASAGAPAAAEPRPAEPDGASAGQEPAAGGEFAEDPRGQAAPVAPTGPAPTSLSLLGDTGPRAETAGAALPKSSDPNAQGEGDQVYAEDWWSHARPILELHGSFRTRAELFHNFSLGRVNPPSESLWTMPADNRYRGAEGTWGPSVCTTGSSNAAADVKGGCQNKTQSSANLRFRLNPEIHVSDNLRILSQIDLLDNLVLGSTPEGYANQPSSTEGYAVVQRNGYAPLSFFDSTQEPPSAGVNGWKDSIRVKRAWAEYSTPVGQLRFGRMPDHFGLGMYHNSGNGYDHNYQSTVDRIMFMTNVRPLDLYIGGSWDFPSEGRTSETALTGGGQAHDTAQLDDVKQYSLIILRQKAPQMQRLSLSRGEVVVNGGAYVKYRSQVIANDMSGPCAATPDVPGAAGLSCAPGTSSAGYVRRDAWAVTPDLWLQVLYKKFRFEAEGVTVQGKMANSLATGYDYSTAPGAAGWRLSAWGVATQLEQKLLEDRLDLGFGFGWASGDPDADKTGGASTQLERGDLGLTPGSNGLQTQKGAHTFSTFRFNPSYQVDLILHRNLLTRVQGTYYFRPSIGYDFLRKNNGQRLGGNFAAIWTRASQFVQAPGHARDLGVELNATVYFQSKDGVLNDRLGTMGGFYTMAQYGLLFPMEGLGYPAAVDTQLHNQMGSGATDLSTAQVVRWYMGVFF